MPKVDLLLAITIALDLTCLQTLNAKIKLFNWFNVGFFLETILKSFLENFLLSGDWTKIELKFDKKLLVFVRLKLFASINLKFFLFFSILSASFSNPLETTTSKKILFNWTANFFLIL